MCNGTPKFARRRRHSTNFASCTYESVQTPSPLAAVAAAYINGLLGFALFVADDGIGLDLNYQTYLFNICILEFNEV